MQSLSYVFLFLGWSILFYLLINELKGATVRSSMEAMDYVMSGVFIDADPKARARFILQKRIYSVLIFFLFFALSIFLAVYPEALREIITASLKN